MITVGGIGTIVAVLGVFLFLVLVVLPLFLPATTGELASFRPDWPPPGAVHVGLDEYQVLGWAVLPDGRIQAFRLDDGTMREELRPFEDRLPLTSSYLIDSDLAVFGFEDGTVQGLRIGFETDFLDAGDLPPGTAQRLLDAGPESAINHPGGVIQITPEGQFRLQRLSTETLPPTRVFEGPVRLVSHAVLPGGPLVVALGEDAGEPKLKLLTGREKEDFLTGETTFAYDAPVELPFESLRDEPPAYLAVSGSGNDVYVGWRSGDLLRVRCRDLREAFIAETGKLTEEGLALTALRFILGNSTLVWGDAAGNVRGGFLVPLSEWDGQGLFQARRHPRRARFGLAMAKTLARQGSPVVALAPSGRSRLIFAAFGDGEIRLFNVTSEAELTSLRLDSAVTVELMAVAPKEDGLLAVAGSEVRHWSLDPRYPEASFSSLFRKVWYEGYAAPKHTWQSSSGTDDFEPKMSLIPLIFGTIKATLYSMIFGAPLALLAAIFTSEFLSPRGKALVKPTIELMASLPSVVLGFLAALVFAPFVERVIATTLTAFMTVPVVFLLGAYLWQLLPARMAIRLSTWRFLLHVGVVPIGLGLAFILGPAAEDLLFAGDLKAWLAWGPSVTSPETARYASPFGGWLLLCLPLCGALAAFVLNRSVNPRIRRWGKEQTRAQLARVDLLKFAAAALLALAAAVALAFLLGALGLDPRGGFIDTYVQRNALVVGFVMGFAIIPIIYTLAEDALSSVPEHLRSASLGTGATPWQTAVRIVVPTAMSGLFSALMIGLGRAVGETMIVLMAAGNTPVLEWNIFEGFRTLSANIAVELPEAVRNSGHYRTLFLAALVLFAMTFLVNTVAELVRLRFRKRSYQL